MADRRPLVKPRLWVASELYFPEQTSSGYFVTRIAEGLAQEFDVAVICGQPAYSERGLVAPRYERHNGVDIHRPRSTHFDKDRLALRAINMFTFSMGATWAALRYFRRGDRILVVTNPPSLPFVMGLVARWRGCRSFLLIHDVYPELMAAVGAMSKQNMVYRLLSRLFRAAFRYFDHVIVLGEDMAEVIAAKTGRSMESIERIANWADTDEVKPIARADNAFRREHALNDKFVVQFSGNIGRTHDVEIVLAAASLLRHRDDIVFLFVGYGGKAKLVADGEGQANLRYLPRQPRARLGEMLAASDATIISFVDGMFGLSVPSRMYNVMAAGVPIIAIADRRSALSRTVAEEDAGWVLPTADAADLASLLAELATPAGNAEASRRGARGRSAAQQKFSLPIVLDHYRALLK